MSDTGKPGGDGIGGDDKVVADIGVLTKHGAVAEVTSRSDLEIVKEKDNHEHDMEYRRVQLQLAQRVVYGVGIFAVAAFFTGVMMENNVVMQTGLTLASTILGVVLTFLFPKL